MSESTSITAPILIADDNTWMQRILAKILLSYGLKPVFASNAFETVALAIEMKPRAVILDIVMPEIDGMQTLRLLKTISITRPIPVLIITAAADPETLGKALNYGAEGFIRKPFTRTGIHEKLSAALGDHSLPSADSSFGRVSDAELDELMNAERKDDHLGTSLLARQRRTNMSITPVLDDSDTSNPASRSAQPEFSVLKRRNRPARKGNVELPDEETVREILRHTSRR